MRNMSFTNHRKIYETPAGEGWWLCRERGEVFVLHERASGALVSKMDLEDFLSDKRGSPQKEALIKMIGSMVQLVV